MLLVEAVRQQASPALVPHNAQTPLVHFVPGAVHAVPVETLVRPGLGHGIDQEGLRHGGEFLAKQFARRA